MSKYYERGNWLLEYHRSNIAHEIIIHFGQTLLIWISKRKLFREFWVELFDKRLFTIKY